MIKSFKELIIWQKSVELSPAVYKATKKFPKEELFGLVFQMKRSAISIPSNIAEGRSRNTKKDFVQFLKIASGSLSELETQVIISFKLKFIDKSENDNITDRIFEINKMLNSMIYKLNS
ncbi:MAG: four helix bundle protein [Patescibacteria group bacterium]|jgi:four helix bundle protein